MIPEPGKQKKLEYLRHVMIGEKILLTSPYNEGRDSREEAHKKTKHVLAGKAK